jgi:hypothetical protein
MEQITQAGNEFAISITLEREETKQDYTLRFEAGGEPMPLLSSAFPSDAPFRILSVRGEWKGATLVVTEKISFQGAEGTLMASYSLAPGGKTLRKLTHITMDAGEFDTKTVYDKN